MDERDVNWVALRSCNPIHGPRQRPGQVTELTVVWSSLHMGKIEKGEAFGGGRLVRSGELLTPVVVGFAECGQRESRRCNNVCLDWVR